MTDSSTTSIVTQAEAVTAGQGSCMRTSISTPPAKTKSALRKIMVSCIDSALEELGPFTSTTEPLVGGTMAATMTSPNSCLPPPAVTNNVNVAVDSMPTAESLYGYEPEPAKIVLTREQLQLRMMRTTSRPRYQRRNSVTKFSLSCAIKDIQSDDASAQRKLTNLSSNPTLVGSMANRQLWHQLYATKMNDPTLLKPSSSSSSTGLPSFHAARVAPELERPAAKRRRGALA